MDSPSKEKEPCNLPRSSRTTNIALREILYLFPYDNKSRSKQRKATDLMRKPNMALSPLTDSSEPFHIAPKNIYPSSTQMAATTLLATKTHKSTKQLLMSQPLKPQLPPTPSALNQIQLQPSVVFSSNTSFWVILTCPPFNNWPKTINLENR